MLIELIFLLFTFGIMFGVLGYYTKSEIFSIISFITLAITSVNMINIEKTYCLTLQNSTTNITNVVQCGTYSVNYQPLVLYIFMLSTIFFMIGVWDTLKFIIIRRKI